MELSVTQVCVCLCTCIHTSCHLAWGKKKSTSFTPVRHGRVGARSYTAMQCVFASCSTVSFKKDSMALIGISLWQILLEHFEKVAPLLSTDSNYSSKMADFLPVSTATVQNCGAFRPLRHPVEVERSHPLTRCYLTCNPSPREEESCGVQLKEGTSAIILNALSMVYIHLILCTAKHCLHLHTHAASLLQERFHCYMTILFFQVPILPVLHQVTTLPAPHRIPGLPAPHRIPALPAPHRIPALPALHRIPALLAPHVIPGLPAPHQVSAVRAPLLWDPPQAIPQPPFNTLPYSGTETAMFLPFSPS